MVRCSKCEKSFKSPTGESWRDNQCKKCWTKPCDLEYNKPEIRVKKMSSPTDLYLDLYTPKEMDNLDN